MRRRRRSTARRSRAGCSRRRRDACSSPWSTLVFFQRGRREVFLLELALLFAALASRPGLGAGIGPVLAARLEILPGRDAALLEVLHEIPQRRPHHLVSEAGIPGDVDAERQV